MKECKHKFKPRYDEVETLINITHTKNISGEDLRNLLIKKVYVKDICIKCGKEIKK